MAEEFVVYEYLPVILDTRTPTQPIFGVWVKTMRDATYLVVGTFHHLAEVQFPDRKEGTWIPLMELRSKVPANWSGFVVVGVSLTDGSVRIQINDNYHRSRLVRKI